MSKRTLKFIYLSVGVITILIGSLIYLINLSNENDLEPSMFLIFSNYTSIIVIFSGLINLITTFTLNRSTALISGIFLILLGFVFFIFQPFFGILLLGLGIISLVFRYKLTYF